MKNDLRAYFSKEVRRGIGNFFSPVENAKYIARETAAVARATKDFFKPKK